MARGWGFYVLMLRTKRDRAPLTVERIERMLLTGQLPALYDACNDGVDFDEKYGAPCD